MALAQADTLCAQRRSFSPSSSFFGSSLSKPAPQRASIAAAPANRSLSIVAKESRIGKQPVEIPKGVTLTLNGQSLSVKGPLGEMSREYPREIKIEQEEDGKLKVMRTSDTRRARAFHGLFRTLTDNMVQGVAKGFEKKLQMVGVGYRAAIDKKDLTMNLGFSHQVRMPIPDGITVKVEENTKITVSGRDKVLVGDFSANIRKWRPPEPYKGKGIKYQDEVIRRKEGKVGKKK